MSRVDEVYGVLNALPPQTPVDALPGVSVRRKANGVPVIRLHYSAIPERDPALNPAWKAEEQKKYTTAGWNREWEIDDQAGGGDKLFADVLAMFDKKIVIRDPEWFPQPWWDVVAGFDHGKTNATVQLKAYLDDLGNLYVCGEFYQMRTEQYANQIYQNVPRLLAMPDIARARWVRADPSIFYDSQVQEDGTFSQIVAAYRKQGVRYLTPFEGEREDLTMEERLNERWANLGEREPSLYIVCRNETDRRQPGLHPWDCPNLLWELRRMRRAELSARQLLMRNPTEKIVDKDNHAWDALKYILLSLPRPTKVPMEHVLADIVKDLNPTSAAIAAQRFMGMQRRASPVTDFRRKGKMR